MDTKDVSHPPDYDHGTENHADDHPDHKTPLTDGQRLSMEDEARPLPEGWIRQLDSKSGHHFYVDTQAKPPRCIWVHPFEDPEWQKAHASREGPPPPPHEYGPPSSPPPSTAADQQEDARPLPHGWKKQIDPSNGHPFYVDSLADPPRTIWVHPFDDPQWQREQSHHPATAAAPSPDSKSSSTQKSAPADDDSIDPLTGALAGGGALAVGLSMLGKFMDSGSTKPSTPQQHQPPPPPPQQNYQNYPTPQGGPGYYQAPPGPAISPLEQQELERERVEDMKQAYHERRRLMDEAAYDAPIYAGAGYVAPVYAPPPMVYCRERTDYGMGLDRMGYGMGMGMGMGLGGGFFGGGRREGFGGGFGGRRGLGGFGRGRGRW
ncbi:hypothetical protein FRB96_006718 [Tulasnella sp. 330]|nr:hypothetical protein FRB96_006718 [Tulasnella sp. 330]